MCERTQVQLWRWVSAGLGGVLLTIAAFYLRSDRLEITRITTLEANVSQLQKADGEMRVLLESVSRDIKEIFRELTGIKVSIAGLAKAATDERSR